MNCFGNRKITIKPGVSKYFGGLWVTDMAKNDETASGLLLINE